MKHLSVKYWILLSMSFSESNCSPWNVSSSIHCRLFRDISTYFMEFWRISGTMRKEEKWLIHDACTRKSFQFWWHLERMNMENSYNITQKLKEFVTILVLKMVKLYWLEKSNRNNLQTELLNPNQHSLKFVENSSTVYSYTSARVRQFCAF